MIISIDIPTRLIPRVQEAIGVKTKAEAQDWLKLQLRQAVISHEVNKASAIEETKVEIARKAQQKAEQDAIAKAETDMIL